MGKIILQYQFPQGAPDLADFIEKWKTASNLQVRTTTNPAIGEGYMKVLVADFKDHFDIISFEDVWKITGFVSPVGGRGWFIHPFSFATLEHQLHLAGALSLSQKQETREIRLAPWAHLPWPHSDLPELVLKAYNRFQQYEQLLQEHWEIAKNLGEAEAEKVMEEYERKLKELQEEIGPI